MADKSKAQTFGSIHKLSIGGTPIYSPAESLHAKHTFFEPADQGAIGTDKPARAGRQLSRIDVGGDVKVQPSYAAAYALLQLWFDHSTGTCTPAADPNAKTAAVVIDRSVAVHTYAACWLDRLELAGAGGDPVDWTLGLMGTTEAAEGAVAALTLTDRMRTSDLTLTIATHTYFPVSFAWRFIYGLEERFANSLTRTSVAARIPVAELELVLDSNADHYADLAARAGTTDAIANAVLAFGNGANTLTITHPEMCVMSEAKVPDRDGVAASQNTVTLRAYLAGGQSNIVSLVYA